MIRGEERFEAVSTTSQRPKTLTEQGSRSNAHEQAGQREEVASDSSFLAQGSTRHDEVWGGSFRVAPFFIPVRARAYTQHPARRILSANVRFLSAREGLFPRTVPLLSRVLRHTTT